MAQKVYQKWNGRLTISVVKQPLEHIDLVDRWLPSKPPTQAKKVATGAYSVDPMIFPVELKKRLLLAKASISAQFKFTGSIEYWQ